MQARNFSRDLVFVAEHLISKIKKKLADVKSVVVAPLNNQTMIKGRLVTLTQSPPPLKSRGNMVETIL